MRTRRQVPAKARRAVPLGLPVPQPKAPQATPQAGLQLPKPHLPRLLRRNFPARPSMKPPSAYRQSSANSPNSKSRKPILNSKWPRTTPATMRVWASSTTSCKPSPTSPKNSNSNGWNSPNSSSSIRTARANYRTGCACCGGGAAPPAFPVNVGHSCDSDAWHSMCQCRILVIAGNLAVLVEETNGGAL